MMKVSILKEKIVEERRAQRIWQYMGLVKKEKEKKKPGQWEIPRSTVQNPINRDV